jgi:hypothetical protein
MATRKASKARKQPGSRRYGKLAGDKVRRSMEEMKAGTLRSGRSGKKVTSREQAIAIGLSEARQMGGKVPAPPKQAEKRSKKAGTKRSSSSGGSRARSHASAH